MDLTAYEESKFELAQVLRTASALLPHEEAERHQRIRELQARLAEDRFNLVVVGRFSRGKSSLMNAVLGHDWLPTGLVPLTSVITTVTYGTKPEVVLEYQDRGFRSKIELGALADHITQAGNPGNIKKIKIAEVHLPAEILRRGFFFVDTPGLGSPIAENTRTTESFLPEADAFLLVTGYESPLSEDEARFLRTVSSSARRVFVVLNKQDTVDPAQRSQALAYVEDQLHSLFERDLPSIFSISARDGLEAKKKQDSQLLDASGLPRLEDGLVQFLLTEKSNEFMLQMCNRVADFLVDLGSSAELSQLLHQVNGLKIELSEGKPDAYRYTYRRNGLRSSDYCFAEVSTMRDLRTYSKAVFPFSQPVSVRTRHQPQNAARPCGTWWILQSTYVAIRINRLPAGNLFRISGVA